MFHILETRPTKVRWCWLARERGTSTASTLLSTVIVLRMAILGGCRNPARCGTPCTCALWNTTSAVTSLRCSSKSRGLTGSNWAGGSGGSAASTSRRTRRWMLSSLLVCEAAHDIQERVAYSRSAAPCWHTPPPPPPTADNGANKYAVNIDEVDGVGGTIHAHIDMAASCTHLLYQPVDTLQARCLSYI
ncbi:hypothetical protein GWK47_011412 [Chionoecetes opilio]|uniref:Uncharacterized protein n=1 Tax=Chionoecetes opilio TaxID=41210 RepID=A0A8J4XZN5_CHIOP|nr:hypothetical protein GWK47_011412 [Chionoecetes opilio]